MGFRGAAIIEAQRQYIETLEKRTGRRPSQLVVTAEQLQQLDRWRPFHYNVAERTIYGIPVVTRG